MATPVPGRPRAFGTAAADRGRMSDMIGRTSIWTAGLALFALASLLCGAAPSLGLLIAARRLESLTTALSQQI